MLTNELINDNSIEWLKNTDDEFRMMFADPPDNINLGYKGFKDKSSDQDYEIMLHDILWHGSMKFDVMWLSINPIHAPLIGKLTYDFLEYCPRWEFKPCVQTFTFGQHNSRDLGRNHRLLYRYMQRGTRLYPEAIRVPSWRQLNGDKRANPDGRVPGDVFEFPRVTGNSRQRRAFSPTQLHEGLYKRCIKLCCAPKDFVVDLFAGSGTLGRVHQECEVNSIMVEISRETCDAILADQTNCREVEW
jgi:DNA modification methylase